MELHVSLTGRGDLAGQIYSQTKAAILDGRLQAGQVIPASRELATRLAVSRNTVSVAYDRLTAEGFLTARVGVGTYVSDTFVDPATECREDPDRAPRPLAVWDTIPDPPDMSKARASYDFRCGTPDVTRFPFATWRSLVADQLRGESFADGAYGEPAGHYGLRTAIARHIGVARAVRTAPEDVVITNGIQHALDVIARVFLRPGDTVAVEDPGYTPARWLFESMGTKVVSVPVDSDGLVVD
ncbi:MAG: PLP-dependent aminotransferase family protein, partial [Actinomycetota bacterium]|nr:PLP-dependent aminotransferase family protein [Actinomycetota bacterium]